MQANHARPLEQIAASPPLTSQRRYDVDWLRTLALGLLIIYHVVITFQPWGWIIGFPVNDKPLVWLWTIMSMINIWRIPILFLISGMGVRFAMERRNWHQLLQDRTIRILLPFVFGYFFIVPLLTVAATQFYSVRTTYDPGPGHLWFLLNIFIYILLLLPFFVYMKTRPDNIVLRVLPKMFQHPVSLFTLAIPLMLEATIVDPNDFVTYAETWHGFWLGSVCFLTGFVFVSLKDDFWQAVKKIRWMALAVGFGLYLTRVSDFDAGDFQNALYGLESMSWMLAILGFGSIYLNRPSKLLHYLSTAVYPVYIFHLPVQFVLSYYIIPLELSAELKLLILVVGTLGISLLFFEVTRRIKWVRPLFGMKLSQA